MCFGVIDFLALVRTFKYRLQPEILNRIPLQLIRLGSPHLLHVEKQQHGLHAVYLSLARSEVGHLDELDQRGRIAQIEFVQIGLFEEELCFGELVIL